MISNNCCICSKEFKSQFKFKTPKCTNCYKRTIGYKKCLTEDCEELVKASFKLCWGCNSDNFKPCETDSCKKYVKKDSNFKVCYTCHTTPVQ